MTMHRTLRENLLDFQQQAHLQRPITFGRQSAKQLADRWGTTAISIPRIEAFKGRRCYRS